MSGKLEEGCGEFEITNYELQGTRYEVRGAILVLFRNGMKWKWIDETNYEVGRGRSLFKVKGVMFKGF